MDAAESRQEWEEKNEIGKKGILPVNGVGRKRQKFIDALVGGKLTGSYCQSGKA